MPLILWAPTGDIYDIQRVSYDSDAALVLDGRAVNESFEAGARLIPTGTYRAGHQLRIGDNPWPFDESLRAITQKIFRHKHRVLSVFHETHPDTQPIINLHGVGTSPYRGPHNSIRRAQEYHTNIIAECLSPIFPHRETPLLYELIPTIEEACVIAHLCREYWWKVVISLYVKRNPEGELCIQNQQGRLIPVVHALKQIEDIANPESSWYAFNCFDPRLVGDLIQLLETSHLWPRVRWMYPNLSDAENDLTYTPVWDETTESHLASWNPPGDTMPAFIGACCGSTTGHIRQLRALLG